MTRRFVVFVVAALVWSCSSSGGPSPQPIPASEQPARPVVQPAPAAQTPAQPGAQPAAAPGAAQNAPAAPADTNPDRNPIVRQLLTSIAGREQEPAGQVFKNVQALKTEPAGDFVRRMAGFSRALGQRCSFCHAAGDWPRDDKKEKLVAREMIDLVNGANARLQRVQGVQANTRIGCNTCHRGNAKPAP
jgi:hypothetical protein